MSPRNTQLRSVEQITMLKTVHVEHRNNVSVEQSGGCITNGYPSPPLRSGKTDDFFYLFCTLVTFEKKQACIAYIIKHTQNKYSM